MRPPGQCAVVHGDPILGVLRPSPHSNVDSAPFRSNPCGERGLLISTVALLEIPSVICVLLARLHEAAVLIAVSLTA